MRILDNPRPVRPEDRKKHYLKLAKQMLTNALTFEPEHRYAKDEIEALSRAIDAKDKQGVLEEKHMTIKTHQCILAMREAIEKKYPKYHRLLDIPISPGFAKKVKLVQDAHDYDLQCTLVDYQTMNIDYKGDARQLVTDELGFAPALRASMHTEVGVRNALKKHKQNNTPYEGYRKFIDLSIKSLKKRIYQEVPEQAHLIQLADIEVLFRGEDNENPKPKLKIIS